MSWLKRTLTRPQESKQPRIPKLIDEVARDYELSSQQLGTYQRQVKFPSDGLNVNMLYNSDSSDDNYEAIAKLGHIPASSTKEACSTILTEVAPGARGISLHVSPQNDIMATISRDFLSGLPDGEIKHAVMDDISRVDALHKRLNRTFLNRKGE